MKIPVHLPTSFAAILLAAFSVSVASAQTTATTQPQSALDVETPAELVAQQVIANSRVRTPETPLSSLSPVEQQPRTPYASGGTPVIGLHQNDDDYSRRNGNRRTSSRRGQRHDGWSFSYNTPARNAIVTRPGRYYTDPSGRVVVIGDNNTVIINQNGDSPYYGYPNAGYPYAGYPYAGYPSHGYPYGYGYPYSYPSTTTYTFGGISSKYVYPDQSVYRGGYSNNYSSRSAYDSYSSTSSSSAWMNSPGTISSTIVTPYPYQSYPGSYYGYAPEAATSFSLGSGSARIDVTRRHSNQ